jgi:DNA-binding transcriptional LysR family regulator
MKNIRTIDLNLLVIFGALCAEKNTTKAANRLGLSQPAVSHALSRLRDQLKDPLFVRASRGLVATKRALELEGPVLKLLSQLDEVLVGPNDFDPLKSQSTFRIATTDYFELVALPKILMVLEREAPGITILSRPTLGSLPKTELENGEYDLAIAGFYGDLPEGFVKQKVFDDDFVCVSRTDHPRVKKKTLSLAQYAEEKHILISPQGDMKSKSQDLLAKKGLHQQFRAGVASFLSPGWILTTTNFLLTCPRKLAKSYEKYLPVVIYELPIEIPRIQVIQVWHERSHRDAAHSWFRQVIHKVCQELSK